MSDEHAATHLLPAPEPHDAQDATKIQVGAEQGVKFDALGPLVVNSDGVNINAVSRVQSNSCSELNRHYPALLTGQT